MAQSEIIRLVQAYIRLLNEAGLKIQKAFLYGSFARGQANKGSDIDVMLVSDTFNDNNVNEKAKTWLLARKVDIRIEPFAIGAQQFFSNNDSPLLDSVKKEGVEIIL
ncbi:hypothetical protein GCM10023093_19820 [Nemorincola caseinilytica]|uniref:Polymerase nucleotidyl transferase domain-containing protein n=1 Tax=Nemorincola caseinilytica TaxID=2054315 RepID=A0ABP8NHX4_9BACT